MKVPTIETTMKVKITQYTPNPIGVLFDQWMSTHPHAEYSDKLINFLLNSNLPILESIHFNIRVEGAPIAFREQLVRNRQAGYWIQSGRETVVDKVYDDNQFFIPETIQKNEKALEIYKNAWKHAQESYKELISCGIDPGDARLIIGSGQNHLINIFTDYRNLITIVGNRLCHIAQVSLWRGFINGIVDELNKIDERLINPMYPKCSTTGECRFSEINMIRYRTVKGELTKDTGADYSGTPCSNWMRLNEDKLS